MARTNPRSARIAGVIQRVVATAVATDLHDPRLKSVTITEVRVTNDMQLARIYWTQLGDEGRAQGERKRAAAALKQASGHLRTLVGRSTGLRLTPQLEFIFDQVPAQATEVEDVLAVARKRDKELEKLRQAAHYAGDPDPYKHDDDQHSQHSNDKYGDDKYGADPADRDSSSSYSDSDNDANSATQTEK